MSNRTGVLETLRTTGALYVKDAGVDSAGRFASAMAALGLKSARYIERTSPRRAVKEGVYTATSYPAAYDIRFHNEMSYSKGYPEVISFCCTSSADEGGETPVSDVRAVLACLPHEIVATFRAAGYRYVRNFDEELGMPWRIVFGVETVEELAAYCDSHDIQFTWKTSQWLQTAQVRRATTVWKGTREEAWFNHAAFFHPASVQPEVWHDLEGLYTMDTLPNATEFADGRPIPAAYISTINAAYETCAWQTSWTNGDLMILNNLLWAHGRRAYTGKREVLTAFGNIEEMHACAP